MTKQKKDEMYTNLLRAEAFIEKCEEQIGQLKKLLEEESGKVASLLENKRTQPDLSEEMSHQVHLNNELTSQLRNAIEKSEREKNELLLEIKGLKSRVHELESMADNRGRSNDQLMRELSQAKEERMAK